MLKQKVEKSLRKQGSDLSDVKLYPVKTIADLNKVISSKGARNTDEQELRRALKKKVLHKSMVLKTKSVQRLKDI